MIKRLLPYLPQHYGLPRVGQLVDAFRGIARPRIKKAAGWVKGVIAREEMLKVRITRLFVTHEGGEFYAGVLKIVLDALSSRYGIFGYINNNGDYVCPSLTRDVWKECRMLEKAIVFPRESWGGIWGKALTQKKTFYSNSPFRVPKGHIPITRAVAVPIVYEGEVIGCFLVGNKAVPYNKRDVKLLEHIAEDVAPLLHKKLESDWTRQNLRSEIAERRKVEAALQESKGRMKATLDALPDLLFEIGREGRICNFHSSAKELLYASPEHFIGKKVGELFPPKTAAIMMGAIKHAVKEGKHTGTVYSLKIGGEIRWFELSIASKAGADSRSTVLVRDITGRVRAEQERDRQGREIGRQKTENAKVRMASRISLMTTDWLSQLWSGIIGSVEIANMDLQDLTRKLEAVEKVLPPEKHASITQSLKSAEELMQGMRETVERGVVVISDIRRFARPTEGLKLKLEDINGLISGLAAKHGGRVEFVGQLGLPEVKVDLVHIQEALSRFIESALAASAKVENRRVRVETSRVREEIKISIKDDGPRHSYLAVGVLREPPFIHGKTFNYEEYLSLSVALKYIEAHGGRMQIDNKNRDGRIIHIWLPIGA
ncbi:MAG: GAF domain-containing protein [Candidatus Margulisiibacteriota bacterium]|nr:GAF domain-containing protein [Candidatus Margulisiibacteriota bacterium]